MSKVPSSLDEVFQGFESLKQFDAAGDEFWSARDLQSSCGYTEWRKFDSVINKAIKACEVSGHDSEEHFVGADKVLIVGNGAQMEVKDYHLSRHGCYLTTQNGDSRKPEIGLAQTFFATNAYENQINKGLLEDASRLMGRIGYRECHKELSDKAVDVGVPFNNLGLFHDRGQRALQGGMSVAKIKEHKGLPANANYADCIESIELSANMLRMSMATERLSRGDISGQEQAIQAHINAGLSVRRILEENDLRPEDLPVRESTRQVVDRIKTI